MVCQTYKGKTFWTFPGGKIEPAETPEETAIREAKEEVGLNVEIVEPLCETPMTTTDGMYYCFLGRVVGGNLALGHDPELADHMQELHEVRWFPLDQVRNHPEVSRIWEALACTQNAIDAGQNKRNNTCN